MAKFHTINCPKKLIKTTNLKQTHGSVVVKELGYKPEGRGFDTR
jgi:hypothetical protein